MKFWDREGKEITVFDLRKNMQIEATKITEAPRTELVASVAGDRHGSGQDGGGTAGGRDPGGRRTGGCL